MKILYGIDLVSYFLYHRISVQKKQRNKQQVSILLKDIHLFKRQQAEFHILIGLDANSFINLKEQQNFHIYPTKQQVATTFKERTWMQPQVSQANTVARSCRDHIISDLNLHNCDVTIITGSNLKVLIPAQMHPYDHYIVCAHLHTQL